MQEGKFGKVVKGCKYDEEKQVAMQHVPLLDLFLDRPSINDMIRKNKLRYGLDLNVTRFHDASGNIIRRRITRV